MMTGYTLPIKDLSDRSIVVDREEGVYLGHVTTLLTDDGVIFASYPKWHGIGQVVLKKSEDGGKTWSDRLPVPASWTISYNTPNLYQLHDSNGKERLMLFSTNHYPAFCSYSEDGGENWTEFSTDGMPENAGYGFMGLTEIGKGHYISFFQDGGEGSPCTYETAGMQQLLFAAGEGAQRRTRAFELHRNDKGEWVDMCYWPTIAEPVLPEGQRWQFVAQRFAPARYSDGHRELYQVESTDGGMTWSKPRLIFTTSKELFPCEPEVIKSPDGTKLLMILRENTRTYNSLVTRSDDLGQTWSPMQELPHGALTGDRHCAKYLHDGRIMITFRDMNKLGKTFGHWVAWIGTWDDLAHNREGEMRLVLGWAKGGAVDCAYGGLEVLLDGTVVVTTYGRWDKGHTNYIRSLRFHPDELKDLPNISL